MRLVILITALAVFSSALAKNSTTKTKPKRQLHSLRTPQNLQYSLVLPHSRVSQYRSLTSSRRISNAHPRSQKLPPYAVQMEPVVQYSQKDPLYDPNQDTVEDLNRNEIFAQPKILNTHSNADQSSEASYGGPPFGSLPTAPLYSHPHPHYYEAPEPIIEIIIKESNETLPAPPPAPILKKKKEPVQVFYVKYSKDPHSHDKVIYEKPIPAITPASNDEDEHEHEHEHLDYVTVTPQPYYGPAQTTTLRAIIKPESEVYHSDSSVKVTFGNEGHHDQNHHDYYSDRREGNAPSEDREETAPRPAIAYPQQPSAHPPLERQVRPQFTDHARTGPNHPPNQSFKPSQHHQQQQFAQSRIQFQPPFLNNEQQLPRPNPTGLPFRGPAGRQTFGPTPPSGLHSSPLPGPVFNNGPPPFPGPVRPFPTAPSRPQEQIPAFHPRPNSSPPFAPRPHFNGPPRPAFHTGPQRPFSQLPLQPQPFFDEPKYLQENYHTITSDQVDPASQVNQNRPPTNFNFIPKPSGPPAPPQFQELRPQHIPTTQLLPQSRPHQQFSDSATKPSFNGVPNRSNFFNLRPSPPHFEENRTPFQPHNPGQFSFHQGVKPRPPPQLPLPEDRPRFPESASPSTPLINSPENHFLPQSPSPAPQFQFSQTSSGPNVFLNSPSERPIEFQHSNNPSERPPNNPPTNFNDHVNHQHQQNVGQFVPNGGELVAAIPRYEQHITVTGPTAQPVYNLLGQSPQPVKPTQASQFAQQYRQQHEQNQLQQQQSHIQQQQNQIQQQQNHLQQQQHQQQQQQQQQHQQQQHQQQQQQQEASNQQQQRERFEQSQLQQYHQQQQIQQQQSQQHQQLQKQQDQRDQQYQHQQQLQHQQQQQKEELEQQLHQQQKYETEQEQVRLQLAQNVQKQQEEIQRLQSQLYLVQQQQSQQTQQYNFNQPQNGGSSVKTQYSQERSRPVTYQPSYVSSTVSPPYYQSTTRTVEIKPTTQKYVSSTLNSIDTTPKPRKEEKKKRPTIELPDEVPDDLRQQLLSSGILDNADISVLDYDKVGDTPLDQLPPDQLANFFNAGGAQQISASENRPIIVSPSGESIQSRIDEESNDDQEISASENEETYEAPTLPAKQSVEMKVVHFNPETAEGEKIAQNYVRDDATRLEPVALNDKKYNRYLPLKVSGNQFPLPDVLKGRKITSVVVLAPVETQAIKEGRTRAERATSTNLKEIKFVAGDSLQNVLKRPSRENFERWLDTEKKTAVDHQSVVLLVTGDDEATDREIFMYDIASGKVNKLDGELSNAFVDAAENNALSKDIEKIAIEGDGTPEDFQKSEELPESSENVPLLVDLSGLSLDHETNSQVSISSGYSKTKHGRALH